MYTNEIILNLRTRFSNLYEEGKYQKLISLLFNIIERKPDLLALEYELINLQKINFNALSDYFAENYHSSIISALCNQDKLDIALEYAMIPTTIIKPSCASNLLDLIGHTTLDKNYDFNNFTYILDKAISHNPGNHNFMRDSLYFILQDHSCATIEHANYIYSKLLEAEGDIDEYFIQSLINFISSEERCPDRALEWLESIGFNKDFLCKVVEEAEGKNIPFERISEEWRNYSETRSYYDEDGSDSDQALEAAAAPTTGVTDEDIDLDMMPTAEITDTTDIVIDTDYITNLLGSFNFQGNA